MCHSQKLVHCACHCRPVYRAPHLTSLYFSAGICCTNAYDLLAVCWRHSRMLLVFRRGYSVQSVTAFFSCLFPSAAACSSISLPPQLGLVLCMACVPNQTSHLRTAAENWQNQRGIAIRCCESHKNTCSPEEATGMQLSHLSGCPLQPNDCLSACVCHKRRACPAQACFVLVVWLHTESLCLTYIAYCKNSACLNM